MVESITLTVNGKSHTLNTDTDRPLLQVLREDLHLTGPKYGCGQAQCGACSVLVDDKRIFSCVSAVKSVAGKSVTTIEGLAAGDTLHPVQQAFCDEGAYQCGFCTAGMIMAAVAFLKTTPRPTDSQIIAGMNRNLCRCCSYPRILSAVKRASA
ncbi:MAG TPA: (2Fe-2S)-binding protein [Phycisphaerae bacterium]|nr:(2Fe-2S)-binding protein [Phycisphaerae bacterium]